MRGQADGANTGCVSQGSRYGATHSTPVAVLTISGAHIDLEGVDDGAVEGPAQEGAGAGTGSLHCEPQSIVLVLHMTPRFVS